MASKKLYVAVAAGIRRELEAAQANDEPIGARAIREVALTLATEFKSDNPRFNRATFLAACGVGDWA